MSDPKRLETFDPQMVQTAYVDCVTRVEKIGGMTHVVFSETRPSVHGNGNERLVIARIAIPNDLVGLVARTIMGGAYSERWLLPGEPDDAEIRSH